MPKVTPFLWFDKNAEEAANFYVSIFKTQGSERFLDRETPCPDQKEVS